MKLIKIIFITSIVLAIIGAVLFFVGAGVKNFSIMWAGLIIFLISLGLVIIAFFCRLALKERRKKVENMKRD